MESIQAHLVHCTYLTCKYIGVFAVECTDWPLRDLRKGFFLGYSNIRKNQESSQKRQVTMFKHIFDSVIKVLNGWSFSTKLIAQSNGSVQFTSAYQHSRGTSIFQSYIDSKCQAVNVCTTYSVQINRSII